MKLEVQSVTLSSCANLAHELYTNFQTWRITLTSRRQPEGCKFVLSRKGNEQTETDWQRGALMYEHILYTSLNFPVFVKHIHRTSKLGRLHMQQFFGSELCSEAVPLTELLHTSQTSAWTWTPIRQERFLSIFVLINCPYILPYIIQLV